MPLLILFDHNLQIAYNNYCNKFIKLAVAIITDQLQLVYNVSQLNQFSNLFKVMGIIL